MSRSLSVDMMQLLNFLSSALEGSVMQISEQGLRKVLYQKIVASFPPGWMSSGQISRDGKSSMLRCYLPLTFYDSEFTEEETREGNGRGPGAGWVCSGCVICCSMY